MTNNRNQLIEEIKERLQKSFVELAAELNEFQKQGLLTELDKKKVTADMEISAQALRDAIRRTDYPEALQNELISRLIIQFENSIKDIISHARSKSFTEDFIYKKFLEIEKNALKDLGISTNQYTQFVSAEWRRVKDNFAKEIKLLSKNVPIDVSKINYIYQNYEDAYKSYVTQQLPKVAPKSTSDTQQNVANQQIDDIEKKATNNE